MELWWNKLHMVMMDGSSLTNNPCNAYKSFFFWGSRVPGGIYNDPGALFETVWGNPTAPGYVRGFRASDPWRIFRIYLPNWPTCEMRWRETMAISKSFENTKKVCHSWAFGFFWGVWPCNRNEDFVNPYIIYRYIYIYTYVFCTCFWIYDIYINIKDPFVIPYFRRPNHMFFPYPKHPKTRFSAKVLQWMWYTFKAFKAVFIDDDITNLNLQRIYWILNAIPRIHLKGFVFKETQGEQKPFSAIHSDIPGGITIAWP